MWSPRLHLSSTSILLASFLPTSIALPQDSSFTITIPTATPSPVSIPWTTKIDMLRAYILAQPDQIAKKGFWSGPAIQLTFTDSQCLQVRFYNWDCIYDVPYKMRGVANWLDSTNARGVGGIDDAYRFYMYGNYVDPDDGWNFYGETRLSFGGCGNRGPQSACGTRWCRLANGNTPDVPDVPPGQSVYLDPSDRGTLCPWLRNGTNATTSSSIVTTTATRLF